MDRPLFDQDKAVFDAEELLARCLGKIELAERVLAAFHSRFDLDLSELREAVRSEDAEAVARVAHRLKGASANVAAEELRTRAAGIEQLARCGGLPEVPGHLEELRSEWTRFVGSASTLGPRPEVAC